MTTMTAAWRHLMSSRPAHRGAPQAVLDIGTSKVCCYIARSRPGHGFAVLGRGYQLADGLKAGEIIDADAAEASIQAVLHEAEQHSGETVRGVVAAIGAGRLRSRLIKVDRPLHGRKIADDDIRRTLERAREEVSDPGIAVLHVIPVEIAVDGGRPLKDPRGLAGQTLEVLVHLVLADIQPINNIVACLERCHLEVKGLIAAPYAAGLGVLTEDEMEQGCLVVDLGAGATQIAHFVGGRLAYLDQILKGGAKRRRRRARRSATRSPSGRHGYSPCGHSPGRSLPRRAGSVPVTWACTSSPAMNVVSVSIWLRSMSSPTPVAGAPLERGDDGERTHGRAPSRRSPTRRCSTGGPRGAPLRNAMPETSSVGKANAA